MKAHTLITLAALAAFTSAAATAAPQAKAGSPAPAAGAKAQAGKAASLSDAECTATLDFIHRAQAATMLAAADAIDEEEEIGEAGFAKAVAEQPMKGMPADLRHYVKEASALMADTSAKVEALNKELAKLRKAEPEDIEEKSKPLRKKYRDITRQHKEKADALEAKYPRATFLSDLLGSDAAQQALADLHNEEGKAKDFMAANPKYKKGKRSTAMAYLRHLAKEKQPRLTAAAARDKVLKLELVHRLGFDSDGSYSTWELPVEATRPIVLPDDRSSGYAWKLAEPVAEDAPVSIEWHTQPSAELRELQDIGVLSTWRDIPSAPDTTVACIRTVKPGKLSLNFEFRKEGEKEPLLKTKVIVEVESDEDGD